MKKLFGVGELKGRDLRSGRKKVLCEFPAAVEIF